MTHQWWNQHSNQLGDWCPWSSHVVSETDGERCPAGCPCSRRVRDERRAAAEAEQADEQLQLVVNTTVVSNGDSIAKLLEHAADLIRAGENTGELQLQGVTVLAWSIA